MQEPPLDQPLGPDAFFRAQLAAGRIMLQRSSRTGRCFFYPRVCEPGTGERGLDWVEASGLGRVYSATTVRQKPEQGGDYNLSLIDLDEGPRLMSRVVGSPPETVAIGARVQAFVGRMDDAADGELLVLFRLADPVAPQNSAPQQPAPVTP